MGVTKRKSSSAEAAGEQPRVPKRTWITPEQYKGIGRYLKPWGKPPTKFTFWCQIITTLVVIIISIGKALESLRDPTFLAFAIVGLLVAIAGKNRDAVDFIPLLAGFFSYQAATLLQAFRPK